ncbi:MAG: protein translocase, SecG subunit [Oscillospiraceae bacterium]|nr:protein translocase, SecG subunit [Oscillospiraceae bacterium]
MNIWEIISGILLLVTSILIILVVIMQESRQSGLSGVVTGSNDSYLGKNKGRTLDSKLATVTKVAATIFFIATIAVNLGKVFFK